MRRNLRRANIAAAAPDRTLQQIASQLEAMYCVLCLQRRVCLKQRQHHHGQALALLDQLADACAKAAFADDTDAQAEVLQRAAQVRLKDGRPRVLCASAAPPLSCSCCNRQRACRDVTDSTAAAWATVRRPATTSDSTSIRCTSRLDLRRFSGERLS